jgi:hypothetical protein
MAAIQGLLTVYRDDPEEAIKNAFTLMSATVEI